MLTVQLAAGCRLAPQLDAAPKSLAFTPLSATFEIESTAFPVFVTTTSAGALVVLTVCEANVTELGDKETTGSGGATPAPSSVTACGLPFALSATRN